MTPEAERAKAVLEACRFWTSQAASLEQLVLREGGCGADLWDRRWEAGKELKRARKRAEKIRRTAVLPPRQLEVLEWRYFAALPWQEVIDRMGLSKSRVLELHQLALEACGAAFRTDIPSEAAAGS